MKALIVLLITVIIAVTGGFVLLNRSQNRQETTQTPVNTSTPIPDEKAIPAGRQVDIKASFKIVTNGTTRIFTDSKYHNKSKDVYIQLPDPGIVYVKKKGITWDDFFKTLPMKLTKDCLTTGTGQTFCTGESGTLRFFLNAIEDKDLLDREIKDGDKILIEFK